MKPDKAKISKPLPTTVFGYDVIGRLGEGAGSMLYVVSEPKTSQIFALKHVKVTDPKTLRFVEQLQNEFEVGKLVRHPSLRKAFELLTKKKLFGGLKEAALVMELIDGMTLENLQLNQALTIAALVECFAQTAAALGALHQMLLIHCDLKPSNIVLQPDRTIKLIDFGQTCKVGTAKHRVQGTPDFIAPEQVRLKPVGPFTDVYNFGATFYWALTRQKVPTYFTVKKSDRDVITEQKFPRPIDLNEMIPEGLSDLVMDCVRVSPAFRPDSMAEVLRRLEPHRGALT